MRPDLAHVSQHQYRPAPPRPLEVLDPAQRRTAEGFLRFRLAGQPTCREHPAPDPRCSQCRSATAWEAETIIRAAKMLRANEESPMSERMMGLTAEDLATWDPGDGADLAG